MPKCGFGSDPKNATGLRLRAILENMATVYLYNSYSEVDPLNKKALSRMPTKMLLAGNKSRDKLHRAM